MESRLGEQVSHLWLCLLSSNHTFWHSCVYGRHTVVERQGLWADLKLLGDPIQEPCVISGDFNTSLFDHKGVARPALSTFSDLNTLVDYCAWHILPHIGTRFTWLGGRGLGHVWHRMDWVYCNEAFHDLFPKLKLTHSSRTTSDHCPLLLECGQSGASDPHQFCFVSVWTTYPNFHSFMHAKWSSYPTIGGMRGLCAKLRLFKRDITKWNKDVFGKIFHRVDYAKRIV